MTAACEKANKGKKEKAPVGGFVEHHKGIDLAQLNIDGGTTDGENNSALSIYAHELGHVVDVGGRFSDDPKWVKLHQTEISNNKGKHTLSRYALKSPSESFAEIHREIVEKGAESVKMKWAKCYAFFDAKGLL